MHDELDLLPWWSEHAGSPYRGEPGPAIRDWLRRNGRWALEGLELRGLERLTHRALVERLVREVEVGALRLVRVPLQVGNATAGGSGAALPIPPAGPATPGGGSSPATPPSDGPMSWYELTIVDEKEQGIAGIAVDMHTPAGTQRVVTGGGGTARVEAPAGTGWAYPQVESATEALEGREQQPRRTDPMPEPAPDLHVRTLRRLDGGVRLPNEEPQTLMLMTRVDLRHASLIVPWHDFVLEHTEGPWAHAEDRNLQLALHADGADRLARVLGPAPEVPDVVPPPPAPPPLEPWPFKPPNTYVVQPGDTLVLIAQRFLGDGARWTEIWDLSKHRFGGRSPDVLYAGDELTMPFEGDWMSPPAPVPSMDPIAPPSSEPTPWLDVALDSLAGDLIDGSFSSVFGVLEALPSELPAPVPPPPPSLAENATYQISMMELVLEGRPPQPSLADFEDEGDFDA